jgi:iron complex outermembrane receptor protein
LFGKTISWAAGVQRRKEKSDDNPDDLQQLGLNGGNVVPRTQGKYDVNGAYVEAFIPLISDIPMIQDFTIELAYRADDYSTAGKVDAFKIGANWTLNDQFRFRAVFANSVRAPDINDLFQGQAQTFTSISDPCSGLGTAAEANMDSVVVANCYSIPDIADAAINGTFNPDLGVIVPGFTYSQPDIQTISGFVGGNENLIEESADTTTFGLVWTPPYVERLSLSVDYYKIEIEDVISSVSATNLINECFETPGLNSTACVGHERFPGTGKLRYWYSFGINQSLLETEGVDVAAQYRFDSLWLVPGGLTASMLWTHRLDHTFTRTSDSTPDDFVGEVGYNDDKVKLTLVWDWNDWLFSADTTWYSSSLDDNNQTAQDYTLNAIDAITYVDLQLRYMPGETWQFYVGADNIFDQDPPYCPSCKNTTTPGSNYTGGQHRPWSSQFFYGGVKYSFGKN